MAKTARPPNPPIEAVGVVGGGFMGAGIAEAVAVAGFTVGVCEVDRAAANRAEERINASLKRAVSGGKLSRPALSAARERISLTAELVDLADAELIIEAVPEDDRLKGEIIGELDRLVSPSALLASNTSSIPIAQLAAQTSRPERVLGLHFFSPAQVMKLVEVVRALDTGDEAIERAKAFVASIGKKPILTLDRSGFVVNMLLVPYLMAAVRMYEEGFAARQDIDDGMRHGCGHPMGPLALCDLIGLDVLYSVCVSLYEEFKRSEYAPPPLLKRMVASRRLGRKSGQGFYEYGEGPEKSIGAAGI